MVTIEGAAGAVRSAPGPTSEATPGIDSVPLEDVRPPLNQMRKRLLSCYQRALKSDPSMGGKLSFRVVFGPDGRVRRVDLIENGSWAPELSACIARALSELVTAPAETERELKVPFVFLPG